MRTFYASDEDARQGIVSREPVPVEQAVTRVVAHHDDDEALIGEVHELWTKHHALAPPAWVDSGDEDIARRIAKHFSYVPESTKWEQLKEALGLGNPAKANLKASLQPHEVKLGWPKGWKPQAVELDPKRLDQLKALAAMEWTERVANALRKGGPLALKVNSGNDLQAAVMGGDLAGESGTATASSATSLTTNSSVNHAANDLAGHVVVVADATTSAYGVITANTAVATNTVLTVDKWYTPGSPGGAAATTPASTSRYVILPGGQPAFWMALTTDATTPGATDTTLTSELTVSGLTRAVATYAHTTGAASYTLTKLFTNPDATARTISKLAIFNSGPATGGRMLFETAIPSPPVLASASDTITPTETVSL